MFKFIFLVAALVTTVKSVDNRRTVETNQWLLKDIHCCNGDTFDKSEYEKFADYRLECSNKIWGVGGPSYDFFNCEELREVREQSICLAECTMRKGGLADNNGNIKRDDLIQHMKNVYKNTEWKVKATEAIIDKCMTLFSKDLIVEEGKCNPVSTHLIHCIWKEYIRTCPNELHNDRLRCTKLRERLEKGDENYLRKVHFLQFIRHYEHDPDAVTKVV